MMTTRKNSTRNGRTHNADSAPGSTANRVAANSGKQIASPGGKQAEPSKSASIEVVSEREKHTKESPRAAAIKSSAVERMAASPGARTTGRDLPSTRPARPARRARTPVPGGRGPSLLDSAAQLLSALSTKEATEGLSTKAIVERLAKQGLWSSPAGKTPSATLYSALLREIQQKKSASRFRRVGPGRFALAAKVKSGGATTGDAPAKPARGRSAGAPARRAGEGAAR